MQVGTAQYPDKIDARAYKYPIKEKMFTYNEGEARTWAHTGFTRSVVQPRRLDHGGDGDN